ncbi:MAG: hypothetical protein LBV69_11565 [Bacteroidales bacterium]|jgi:RNA polymerase sigma-70 factor (ECF subfamily)|nr:hypothetical protein [Bacteroidales bacterium]
MPQITKKNIEKMTDDELICYYKQYRDIDCVGELYKRYTGLTFAICMKYLKSKEKTEEIVLEIFEDLIEKLLIHDIENFKNWLYSVAKNHCLLKIRSFKSEVDLEINENIL